MSDEHTLDLIQRAIDGEITSAERAELDRIVAADPRAAEHYTSLKTIAAAVEQIEEVDPPAGLRQTILDGVPRPAERAGEQPGLTSGFLTSLRRFVETMFLNGGVAMNKKIWITTAAVVVLAAVVGYFGFLHPPGGRDSVGAIGAVEKHRAEQIGDQDVILTAYETSPEYVPYTDILDDSAKLQNAAADLGAMSALAARAETAGLGARLQATHAALKAHADSLDARLQLAMKAHLGAFDNVLGSKHFARLAPEQLKAFQDELGAMNAMLEARTLNAATLGATVDRLVALHRDLGAKMDLEAMSLVGAQSKLAAFNEGLGAQAEALNAMKLEAFQADLEAASSALEMRKLGAAVDALGARNAYFAAMNLEMKKLEAFNAELGAASQLEAAMLGAKADSLGAWSADLAKHASKLEAKALMGMSSRLEAFALEQKTLGAMSRISAASRQALDARSQELEAAALGSMKDALGALDLSLEARSLAASQLLVGEMKMQLGASNQLLAASELQLGAATLDALGSHMLGVNSQLEASSGALEAMTLEAMSADLGAVNSALEARRLALD